MDRAYQAAGVANKPLAFFFPPTCSMPAGSRKCPPVEYFEEKDFLSLDGGEKGGMWRVLISGGEHERRVQKWYMRNSR